MLRKTLLIGLSATLASLVVSSDLLMHVNMGAAGHFTQTIGHDRGFPTKYLRVATDQAVSDWELSWAGMSINLAVWSAMAWAIMGLAVNVRRTVRTRGGRCVSCGYDLHGLPEPRCPECGNEEASDVPQRGDR